MWRLVSKPMAMPIGETASAARPARVPCYPYFSSVEALHAIGAEHYRLLDQSVAVPSDTATAIGGVARLTNTVVPIGVNECDLGTVYNRQLLFDADGKLVQRCRNLSPTYPERFLYLLPFQENVPFAFLFVHINRILRTPVTRSRLQLTQKF